MKLLYQASVDGFESINFHNKCDYKGYTVILIVTETNKIFGGFTELEWSSDIKNKDGNKGFIFSFSEKKIYYNKNKYRIYCSSYYGPDFYEAFYIIGKTGHIYKYPPYEYFDFIPKDHNLAWKYEFSIKDYAVFQIDI